MSTLRGGGSSYSSSESEPSRPSGLASGDGDEVPIRRSGEASGEASKAAFDESSLPTLALPGFSLMSESVADFNSPDGLNSARQLDSAETPASETSPTLRREWGHTLPSSIT